MTPDNERVISLTGIHRNEKQLKFTLSTLDLCVTAAAAVAADSFVDRCGRVTVLDSSV